MMEFWSPQGSNWKNSRSLWKCFWCCESADGSLWQLHTTGRCIPSVEAYGCEHYRSIVGMALYLGRDRPDAIFAIKEFAGRMSRPTLISLQHLKKLVGYLKHTGNVGVKLSYPMPGQGKYKTSTEKMWILETYSDADWAGNRARRKSTSCGIHYLNGKSLYGSSRTQKVVSLSSCESELHSIVSAMSDAIFVRRCLEFLLETLVLQVHYTDGSSSRQLVSRQGCGKIRHLSGKLLWVQGKIHEGEVQICQIPTILNSGDIRTKPLAKRRLLALMCEVGMIYVETMQPVGGIESAELVENAATSRSMNKLAKTVMKLMLMMGLGPLGAEGQEEFCNTAEQHGANENFWIAIFLFALVLSWWFLVLLQFGSGDGLTEGFTSTNCNRQKQIVSWGHSETPLMTSDVTCKG